jgi:uncharacterized protein
MGYLRILAVSALLLAGCSRTPPLAFPTGIITVKGVKLTVEVASKPAERYQGLRFRQELRPGHGMIFLFSRPDYQCFVMEDTAIPLSIAFIDRDGAIVQIERMDAFQRARTWSAKRVWYVLEVAQGWFAANGIAEGDRIEGIADLVKEFPPG